MRTQLYKVQRLYKQIIIFLVMEQKALDNIDLDRPTSRRSRKDEEGRDFQCGCGKRYLSYPALYTHIKTKHDGRQPQGTQKTGPTLIVKRIKYKHEQQNNKTISNYIEKCDLKLLAQLDQNYQGSVSLNTRFKKESLPKDLYECYNALSKLQEINITKASSLDSALVAFLYGVGQYVNEKLYEHYLLFAKLVRNCFSEHGEEVYRACFSNKERLGLIENFTVAEVQFFPIICDCLMRYYIPFSQRTKQFKDINLSLMQLMLSDFCDWLYKKRLTLIKVTLKKEYRLQRKLSPLEQQKIEALKNQQSKQKQEMQEQSMLESNHKNHEGDESMSDYEENEDIHIDGSHGASHMEEEKEQSDKNLNDSTQKKAKEELKLQNKVQGV